VNDTVELATPGKIVLTWNSGGTGSDDPAIAYATRVRLSAIPLQSIDTQPGVGGSAFTFTMFQAPGQPDDEFEGQSRSLSREFDNLVDRFGAPPPPLCDYGTS
jgi:hypothetical protein